MEIVRKLVKKLKKNRDLGTIREISYRELKELIKTNTEIEIVDIRSPQEYAENKIRFAINIPLYDLKKEASKLLKDKNKTIILYCQHGSRSKKAYEILENQGYTNLYSLRGGIEGIE